VVGTVYSLGPDHDFGVIELTTGVWSLHVAVTGGTGAQLGGSFAIPVN
jgi:hypothetical protein